MTEYTLSWISDHLAVGHAPMSFADLESIRDQGVTAIVNLCAEYCDLHQIETGKGFAVFYLPVFDECAPDMAALEEGLDWVDRAMADGHKILVHCHHGIGRSGTFLTAHLLRRGMDLKAAEKHLKKSRAAPTNYCQWKLLRRYHRKLNPT